ncbi:FxsA family protein [Thioclava sp. GXIMD4216]|uniref:FxsA family protein n=1 Tax=Thioclava litoralis TaxID=3076557 RepID=A0ABZ1DYT4_9RHOB|nr:FxsA family protein [Thioclava sp. FTW29]
MWIFLAFLLVPIIEIGLFIQVGGLIGLWPTLAIVVLTAIIGTSLVRSQGAQAMAELRRSMAELNDPSRPLAHGALILLAGALLLTPGFFTDTCGLLLLIPAVRDWVTGQIAKRVRVQGFQMGGAASQGFDDPAGYDSRNRGMGRSPANGPGVIDGEFEEIDTENPPRPGNSGWTRH